MEMPAYVATREAVRHLTNRDYGNQRIFKLAARPPPTARDERFHALWIKVKEGGVASLRYASAAK